MSFTVYVQYWKCVMVCVCSFTYEVAPVFILMEEVILKKMQSIVGWSEEEGDGIFSPGNASINHC